MTTNEILQLFDQQARRQAIHPDYRREEADGVVRHISLTPDRNSFIVYHDLTSEMMDAAIVREMAYFPANGRRFIEWRVYEHDLPVGLGEKLKQHGFIEDEVEPLLVLDLHDMPVAFHQSLTADVRRVVNPDDVPTAVGVTERVWEVKFDWLTKMLQHGLRQHPDFWSLYIAYVDGQPASVAWACFSSNSQFANLFGGATIAEYRQQGLYTALVAARAQEALQRGYRFLYVTTTDASRAVLSKRGFRLLTHLTAYNWDAPE